MHAYDSGSLWSRRGALAVGTLLIGLLAWGSPAAADPIQTPCAEIVYDLGECNACCEAQQGGVEPACELRCGLTHQTGMLLGSAMWSGATSAIKNESDGTISVGGNAWPDYSTAISAIHTLDPDGASQSSQTVPGRDPQLVNTGTTEVVVTENGGNIDFSTRPAGQGPFGIATTIGYGAAPSCATLGNVIACTWYTWDEIKSRLLDASGAPLTTILKVGDKLPGAHTPPKIVASDKYSRFGVFYSNTTDGTHWHTSSCTIDLQGGVTPLQTVAPTATQDDFLTDVDASDEHFVLAREIDGVSAVTTIGMVTGQAQTVATGLGGYNACLYAKHGSIVVSDSSGEIALGELIGGTPSFDPDGLIAGLQSGTPEGCALAEGSLIHTWDEDYSELWVRYIDAPIPLPEPGAATLLASGVAGLGLLARRSSRRR